MVVDRKTITKFKHEFELPDKEFKNIIKKELGVTIFKDVVSHNDCMRGTRIGINKFTTIYYEVKIPKYLKDYLLDKLPDYDRLKNECVFNERNLTGNKITNFTSFIRFTILTDVEKTFHAMSRDAVFMQELGQLEKLNKVIFVSSTYTNDGLRGAYNHADLNKNVGIAFHYFVCYETIVKDSWGDDITRYYGLTRSVTKYATMPKEKFRNELPLIRDSDINLAEYTKIKWTAVRELFLEQMQAEVLKLSDNISKYVKDINDDNFELIMSKNQKMIEDK